MDNETNAYARKLSVKYPLAYIGTGVSILIIDQNISFRDIVQLQKCLQFCSPSYKNPFM